MTKTAIKEISRIVKCKCGREANMTAEDEKFNLIRLAEQKEFRKVGQEFEMNLKYTCSLCGIVLIHTVLRLKQKG